MLHAHLLLAHGRHGRGGGSGDVGVGGERAERGLRVQLSSQRAVLLLELAAALTLLTLDSLALGEGQHLLVLDAQLPAVELEVVHGLDDGGRLLGGGEVGKGQAPEDAVVEVVVEGIGQGQAEVGHELDQLLLLDGEGDVLDDDGGGDQLLVDVVGVAGVEHGARVAVAEAGQGKAGQALLLGRRRLHPALAESAAASRRRDRYLTAGRALRAAPRVCDFMRGPVAPPSEPRGFCAKAFVFQPCWAPMS